MIINERKKYMDVFNHVDHQLLLIHKDVNVSIVVLLCVPRFILAVEMCKCMS